MLTVVLFASINHHQIKGASQTRNNFFGTTLVQLYAVGQSCLFYIFSKNVLQLSIRFDGVQHAVRRQTFRDANGAIARESPYFECKLGLDPKTNKAQQLSLQWAGHHLWGQGFEVGFAVQLVQDL